MGDRHSIAGYCRISVDDEKDQEKNISIENQRSIIEDWVKTRFCGSELTFFEDRDRSGYTFEQREGYQRLRRGLMSHKFDILIVKDFSRFSRRNSRGLVELEDLRDAGVRIISIGDGIDFPNDDDWLKIQFQFLLNEMPVTDTSKKVRNVIRRRQAEGEWLCAAPYGYILNKRREFEIVPTEAETVRTVFRLYNDEGWGYKKIANYLTDEHIPTPRMGEQLRAEADGRSCNRRTRPEWSIVTVQGILDNDFYIGTLRQGKTTRAKINGRDVRRDEGEQIVIENHHQAIIDYRTFALTRALRQRRTKSNYRGVKKNDNVYSGFLFCGDCGSPMFAMSRSDLSPAYICGTYHRRGRAGCTSHHIRADRLDAVLKLYVRRVMENSAEIIAGINEELARENSAVVETEQSADNIAQVLDGLRDELRVTKRQRIREIMKKPEKEDTINEVYDEMEAELENKIEGLSRQIELLADRRNLIIQTDRAAKTAMDIFDDILNKEKLDRQDLELIIQRITVFEDHIEIKLQSDIDALLNIKTGEDAVNFNSGTENEITVTQSSVHHADRVFRANVISDGDALEIFTDRDGQLIFKKYSPVGELSSFAESMCESLRKAGECTAAICDTDNIIAAAGSGKRELLEKPVSPGLSELMNTRRVFSQEGSDCILPVGDSGGRLCISAAAPIVVSGDVCGCVMLLDADTASQSDACRRALAAAAADFLAAQLDA